MPDFLPSAFSNSTEIDFGTITKSISPLSAFVGGLAVNLDVVGYLGSTDLDLLSKIFQNP
jgi:hypothetical protein